jgi:chloramphenicol O-acetyltransferase type A
VWGKFFQQGDRILLPLGVQGHHALIDGVHIGRFYREIETYLQEPELILG